MKRFAIATAACLAAFMPAAVSADELSDARAAFLEAWDAAPLSVRKGVLVNSEAQGFGILDERSSNVFAPGDPILIYIEPVGYGWKPVDGLNELGLNIGLRILTPGEDELFRNDDFLVLTTRSLERPTEFFGNVTLTLDGFPVGEYVLELNLSDIASDDTTMLTLPIEIR